MRVALLTLTIICLGFAPVEAPGPDDEDVGVVQPKLYFDDYELNNPLQPDFYNPGRRIPRVAEKPIIRKPKLVIALGDDENSKFLKSELERDWEQQSHTPVKELPYELWCKLQELNFMSNELRRQIDIEFIEEYIGCETPSFRWGNYGDFQLFDPRTFSTTTIPLKTVKWLADYKLWNSQEVPHPQWREYTQIYDATTRARNIKEATIEKALRKLIPKAESFTFEMGTLDIYIYDGEKWVLPPYSPGKLVEYMEAGKLFEANDIEWNCRFRHETCYTKIRAWESYQESYEVEVVKPDGTKVQETFKYTRQRIIENIDIMELAKKHKIDLTLPPLPFPCKPIAPQPPWEKPFSWMPK